MKYYWKLTLSLVFILSCDNKNTEDLTPPVVSIISPANYSTVSGWVTVESDIIENGKIDHVELWVNGDSTGLNSNVTPYSIIWPTNSYADSANHWLQLIAYDKSNNKGVSDTVWVTLDNSQMNPNPVIITEIKYIAGNFRMSWDTTGIENIKYYRIYKSSNESMSDKTLLAELTDTDITSYNIEGSTINENIFYQVGAVNIWDFESFSQVIELGFETYIYFTSDMDGDWDIYKMPTDLSGIENLTNNNYDDWLPNVSENAYKIAYVSDVNNNGNFQVFIMNTDGTDKINLTNDDNIYCLNAIYNESIRMVYYYSYENQWALKSVSTRSLTIRHISNGIFVNTWPQYTPLLHANNNKVVFEKYISNSQVDIYEADKNGSSITSITTPGDYIDCISPTFSPDESKMAYINASNLSSGILHIMTLSNQHITSVTDFLDAQDPHFSPDGSIIVFTSRESGNKEIYAVNSNGQNTVRLTDNNTDDFNPQFSPDGQKLVFISTRDGNQELYMMNIDGTSQTRLTNTNANEESLSIKISSYYSF